MQKAQQDAWAQCSVRRGAARRDGQGSFNAAPEFSPFAQNFPLVSSCEEKIRYVPREKNGTVTEGKIWSQVPNRWAGAGRDDGLGRDGGPGRDGGRGRARVGWGTCVFRHRNVRRNRLECRFGAEHQGENPVLFTRFFPRGTGYFPRFPGYFLREKSGEFEEKIRCYHASHCPHAPFTQLHAAAHCSAPSIPRPLIALHKAPKQLQRSSHAAARSPRAAACSPLTAVPPRACAE